MMQINDFLNSNYVKHGRVYPDLDCYGLVRLARKELFGRELLPAYEYVDPMDKSALTVATNEVLANKLFTPVQPCQGAVATAWRARMCVHVGLVIKADDRVWILETDVGTGPVLTRIALFEQRYTQVTYYDN